ncbi:MAG: DNA repair protein RadA [Planctomycetota bacterium]|nr:DNA repair protein RadA [Planctomycetota bacterium]
MAKRSRRFVCRECGGVQLKWSGKCPECGAWDSLEDFVADESAAPSSAPAWSVGGTAGTTAALPLSEVSTAETTRATTGISELDRALGGGFVPGSAVMIGGDPGIGKSTLLLQALSSLAARGQRTLYASSEESAQQVKLRAQRILTGDSASRDANLFLLSDTNLARIFEQAKRIKPTVMVVDSIQLVHRADIDALPGSVTQLRRSCLELVQFAKATGIVVVLVGHVTKDGDLAGPRMLEHMVDCVLGFEGDRHHAYRVVRAVKNRFGSTHEIGIFEMTNTGLAEVEEGRFDAESTSRPGVVIVPTLAGSRCLMAEVQALAAGGFLGNAKRKSSGIDPGRLTMMIAVLEKHAGLRLGDQDLFASAGGGIRIVEPAADLAVGLAVASAFLGRSLPASCAVLGEVALSGEIRPVRFIEQRLAEAARRGCRRAIVPSKGMTGIAPKGLELLKASNIYEAVGFLEAAPSTPFMPSRVKAKVE